MAIVSLDKAVKELYYWQFGSNPTNFTSRLFELMAKADMENAARLAKAFPIEAQAFLLWYHASDQSLFFESWGYGRQRVVQGTGEEI